MGSFLFTNLTPNSTLKKIPQASWGSLVIGGSAGKESVCNAGDPGSIPGLGRPPGEGIGYPLQYSWASLVAWLVKNPPAMQETLVWSLGWEAPLEKGTVYPLQYSGLENSMVYIVHGVTKSQTWLSDFHFHFLSFSSLWINLYKRRLVCSLKDN